MIQIDETRIPHDRSILSKEGRIEMGRLRRMVKSSIKRLVWPSFRTDLREEIIGLEGIKTDWTLGELREFPELERTAWRGLASLGYEIVKHYRPKRIVELGSAKGMSTFSMGLALRDLGEGGRLIAVDTWEGDEHIGAYGEVIYDTFMSRRKQLGLDGVIEPLRMTFDEARAKIPAPVDLLHIDGYHTWQAVTHDLRTYKSLVRPGGLILFHDVRSRFPGMRRFWRWIAWRYEHHRVLYSHGLGIIRV
jgi:predicted O-methyltransferase YrrM